VASFVPTHILGEHARRLGATILARHDVMVATQCADCELAASCDLSSLQTDVLNMMEARHNERRVLAGTTIFRAGDSPANLYVSRTGMCKSVVLNPEGRQIIPRFYSPGELMGLDGFANFVHQSDAIALEDTHICIIRYQHLQDVLKQNARAAAALHRLLSIEILRETGLLMILVNMNAEERMAAFLLDFSTRYDAAPHQAKTLTLPMSREDIGVHLGMRLETVSRVLSRLQRRGLINITGRQLTILQPDGLRSLTVD